MRLKQGWLAAALAGLMAFAPSNTARAQEELVENPAYASWAAHKPGTKVVMDMATAMGPMNMTMELTQTLLELDADKAVVEAAVQANVPGVPAGQGHKQKHTLQAKVAKSEAEKSKLPPGTTGEMKEVAGESIEVAGKKYECKVYEFKGKNEQGEQAGKVWNTTEIPGGLAKMTSKGQANGQEMTMTMTVKSVETK